MENKIEAMNVAEEAIVNDGIVEELGNKKIKKPIVAIGIVAAVVGATVLARKYKGKIKELRIKKAIKKLEKNGYSVCSLDMFDENDDVEVNP